MAHVSKRLALVRDAIEIVLRRLSTLPPSTEVEELRVRAEECLREADAWGQTAPTMEQREALMKRVLGLHTAIARLERSQG